MTVSHRRLATVLVALAAGLFAWPAIAGKVDDLSKLLLDDPNYKVRVQAAVVFRALGDPAATDPLVKALGDSNKAVRGTVAQALAKIGTGAAVAPLQAALKREQDPFVRREFEKALAALGLAAVGSGKKTGVGAGGKPKIFLAFGPFSGGTRSADGASLELLRTALRRELGKLSSVTFTAEGDEKNFGRSGQLGFLIDGNVTRLDDGTVAGAAETNCDVKVTVARWPSRSIILWTNAGAAVQAGSRPQDRQNARRDCLEASAGQLGEDLTKFFQSQGG